MELRHGVLYNATAEQALTYVDDHLQSIKRTASLKTEPQLTAVVPRGNPASGFYTDRVLLELDYGALQEWWRLTRISKFRGERDRDRDTSVTFRARWADLKYSVAEQHLASGGILHRFVATDRTVQEALDLILSSTWNAPSLYTSGTVAEPLASRKVFFEQIGVTHWDLLRTLASEVNAEIKVEWDGTGYEVTIVDRLGRPDGPMITMNPLNAGIPYQSLTQTSDASQYTSRIYPVIQAQDAVVSLKGLWWPIASSTVASSETTLTLDFDPLWEDLPLGGLQAEGDSGTLYGVVSTTAPRTVVLEGDASGEDRIRFSDPSGAPLTYVPDLTAEDEQGVAGTVKAFQVNPRENLLERYGVSPNGSTDGWSLVSGATTDPTLSTISSPDDTRYGTTSLRVETTEVDQGIEAVIDWDADIFGSPYASAYVSLRIVTGTAGVQLIDSDGTVFPPVGSDEKIVASGETLLGYQLGGFEPVTPGTLTLRIFARDAVTDLRVDAVTVTASEGPQQYSALMGPRALWQEASKEMLRSGGIRPDRFQGDLINLGSVLMDGPSVDLGDTVTVEIVNPMSGPERVETRIQEIVEELSFRKEALTQRVKVSPPALDVTKGLRRLLS